MNTKRLEIVRNKAINASVRGIAAGVFLLIGSTVATWMEFLSGFSSLIITGMGVTLILSGVLFIKDLKKYKPVYDNIELLTTLTYEEAYTNFDRVSRTKLGLSGEEFLKQDKAGLISKEANQAAVAYVKLICPTEEHRTGEYS